MKKTLTYIANARLPTEKAHGIQIIKMCEAFADNGLKVTLIAPKRKQINKDLLNTDIYDYYQVKKNFKVKKIFNIDLLPLDQIGINTGIIAYLIQEISFSISAFILTFNKKLIYTRSKTFSLLRGIFGKYIWYESHDSPKGSLVDKLIAQKSNHIICITKSIQENWKHIGAKTLYAPDGVGDEFFSKIDKKSARKKLNLSREEKIVLYTGNLYPWKGVDILFQAAKQNRSINFYIVGGSVIDKNIKPLQLKYKNIKNIHILGHQPYKLIPHWLKAADILVLPNSAKTKKGREDTSPLKLFEYMASGTPILASHVPAIEEILSEKEATFSKPDDPQDMNRNLEWMIRNYSKVKSKAEKASLKAKSFTWKKRTRKIISELEKL